MSHSIACDLAQAVARGLIRPSIGLALGQGGGYRVPDTCFVVAAVKPGPGDEVWPGESVGRAHRKAGTATTLRIDVIASGPDYITSFFKLCNGFQHTALAQLQPIRETAVTRPRISVVVIDEIQESAEHARGISADYIAVVGM